MIEMHYARDNDIPLMIFVKDLLFASLLFDDDFFNIVEYWYKNRAILFVERNMNIKLISNQDESCSSFARV